MDNRDANVKLAGAYLRENDALREAVGAIGDEPLEPRYLGVGEHNLNYRFAVPSSGAQFVLRINVASQPFHDDQVAYEFGALKALEPSGRTPAPVYLDNSGSAPGEGALVIGFCEGDMLDFDHLRPGDLRCVAQVMADVHAVPVAAGCTVYRPTDPLVSLFEECLQRFETYRSSAFEDSRITRWVETFIKAAEPMTRTSCRPSDCTHIINTETLPSHFLIPAQFADAAAAGQQGPGAQSDGVAVSTNAHARSAVGSGCETAPQSHKGRFCDNPGFFVDWERPVIGEVAQDVAYFTAPTTTFWDSEYLFPAEGAAAFVDDYWRAVDGRFAQGNFDERFRAYRMMTALRSTTWCARALIAYGRGGTGHTTDKTARKLPIYLSDDFMHLLAVDCFGLM